MADIVCFKFQNFADIKSQCLKERQLFVDPEFTYETALGEDTAVESEPEKNASVNLEGQCKEKSSENEECSPHSSSVKRVPR